MKNKNINEKNNTKIKKLSHLDNSNTENNIIIIIIGIGILVISLLIYKSVKSFNKIDSNLLIANRYRNFDKKENIEIDNSENLVPIIIEPKSKHKFTLIFIHGLGSSPEDYKTFWENGLKYLKRDDLKIVLLRAPEVKVTLSNSKTNSWFDIYKFPMNSENTYNYTELKKSAKIIENYILKEAKILNYEFNKIFIGGHSQGSILSLFVGYTYKYLIGGVLACNGFLCTETNILPNREKLNVFLGHNKYDQIIPFKYHVFTTKRIENFIGVKKFYYNNRGHGISDNEFYDMLNFLNQTMK